MAKLPLDWSEIEEKHDVCRGDWVRSDVCFEFEFFISNFHHFLDVLFGFGHLFLADFAEVLFIDNDESCKIL